MKRTKQVTKPVKLACWALTALSLLCGGVQALAKENSQTGVAEVNGTKLYYETAGKGPAVVLVHGGLHTCVPREKDVTRQAATTPYRREGAALVEGGGDSGLARG